MSKYLDKFRSTLPVIQGKQIFQLLNQMKDSGQITSVDEYNTKLQELSTYLKTTNFNSIFKFFEAKIGNVISSDTFNTMVKAASYDLESIFSETDTISSILDLHKSIYKLTVMQALQKAIVDLSKTINFYEFLNNDTNGFTQAQFNTFSDISGLGSNRSDMGSLFYDPRLNVPMSATQDCTIDYVGQQLVLPFIDSKEIKITNVSLVDDADTTVSVKNIQNSTNNIHNLVDQQAQTYWFYPVLLNEVKQDVKIKLKLDLGGLVQINSLKIEPVSNMPMVLEKVSYIGSDTTLNNITVEQTINTNTVINLTGITTQYLILTFRQDNYEKVSYHYNAVNNLWEKINTTTNVDTSNDPQSVDRLGQSLRNIVSDPNLRQVMNIPLDNTYTYVQGYQYNFGFDNLRVYTNTYQSSGIFIGQKFSVVSPGLIGLKATEVNPTVTIGTTSYKQFSFEYYLTKYNYDLNGSFLNSESIPILPIENNGLVVDERLFLTQIDDSAVNNVATMRFIPNISTTPVLYSNLSLPLVIGAANDYQVKVDGIDWVDTWADVETQINTASGLYNSMEVQIKFTSPSVNNIYTVSYKVSTRESANLDAKQRKLSQFIIMQDNFILRCSNQQQVTVAKSDLYLVVIMRNLYLDNTKTASVKDYKLLVSSYDPKKFLS